MPLRCCTDLLYIGCEDTGEAILGGHSQEAAGVVKLDLSFLLAIRRQSLLTSTGFSPGALFREEATMSEAPRKSKITASRRLHLKTKLLKMASVMLEKDKEKTKQEREATLNERLPPLKLSGLSLQDLQTLCKDLHSKIDVVDEERYDIEAKVVKNNKEIENLSIKVFELKGKMKRPALKRVKISADAMLGALFGAKVKESVDFKANLKTVKKEDEKKEEVTDWRKNVEAMSGMEGRKKLFDAGQ